MGVNRARAIFFTGANEVTLGETEIPDPGPGEILIRAEYTCISPGTELRCLAGRQEGTPGWPFIPGYTSVGRVLAQGEGATLPIGTRVLWGGTLRCSSHRLWGGHVELGVQSEAAIHVAPEGMDLRDAAAARLASIAYHGVRRSRPQPGATVAVIGLGAIGQLAARVHALWGARVMAADLAPERVEIARAAGIDAFVPAGDLDPAFKSRLPEGADVVVETTGVPGLLHEAVKIAREQPRTDEAIDGARILIQASYPEDFSIPYMAAFRKELTFLLPRDKQSCDITSVLELISAGKLKAGDLISEVAPPENAPEIYRRLQAQQGLITAAFDWRG
jgi:2-desacetyl-2-hydroxyethyl bacteriochlorophyllide A dehydrogenase